MKSKNKKWIFFAFIFIVLISALSMMMTLSPYIPDPGGTPGGVVAPEVDPFHPFPDTTDTVGGNPNINYPTQPFPDNTITTTGFDVEYNWLTVTPIHPSDSKVHVITGGFDLVRFDNLGSIPQDSGISYMAKAEFGFELTAFQTLAINDVFPQLKLDQWTEDIVYGGVVYTALPFLPVVGVYSASVKMNYIDLGELVSYQFDGIIPLNIGINPTFSNLDNATVSGIAINHVAYQYEVKVVTVEDKYYGTCGDYNDHYTNQQTNGDGITAQALDKTITVGEQIVMDKIANLDIGWSTGTTSDYLSTYTLQQMAIYGTDIGATQTNCGSGDMTFLDDIMLQAGVTKTTQRVDFRAGGFCYDTIWKAIYNIQPIQTAHPQRPVSAHVYLPYVHQTFKVTVYFIANVAMNAELYQSALSDPHFMRGDWVWDPSARDRGLVIITQPGLFDFWWIWLIIAGLVLIIIIWIYSKLKRSKIIVNVKK